MPDELTYFYRYVDLDAALDYVDKPDCRVWYFRLGQENPPRCERVEDRPVDAIAAVVACIDDKFDVGDKMGLVRYVGSKDPIPPPPPPTWHDDLKDYLSTKVVIDFFNGIPRATDPL